MPYKLEAMSSGHVISACTKSAEEAYAKAIEWQIAKQFTDVTISDGRKNYSIAEFAAKMALAEISVTERSFDSF